jgi:hypothetical protein
VRTYEFRVPSAHETGAYNCQSYLIHRIALLAHVLSNDHGFMWRRAPHHPELDEAETTYYIVLIFGTCGKIANEETVYIRKRIEAILAGEDRGRAG